MIDWEPKDTIPDLREKISFLRRALREAHRREEELKLRQRRTEVLNDFDLIGCGFVKIDETTGGTEFHYIEDRIAEAMKSPIETWNDAIEAAATELQHHLSTEEDAALSEVWQERILELKKEITNDQTL